MFPFLRARARGRVVRAVVSDGLLVTWRRPPVLLVFPFEPGRPARQLPRCRQAAADPAEPIRLLVIHVRMHPPHELGGRLPLGGHPDRFPERRLVARDYRHPLTAA